MRSHLHDFFLPEIHSNASKDFFVDKVLTHNVMYFISFLAHNRKKNTVQNKRETFAKKIGLVHTYKLSCLKLVMETDTVTRNDKVPGTIP